MNWRGKRVFVAGGTGFIGGHLVNLLVSLGAKVKLLIHDTLPQNPNLVGEFGCVTNGGLVRTYLERFQPEYVFYLVAQPIVGIASKFPLQTFETNVRGTYAFLDACKGVESIKSIVYISTDKVYGDIEEISDDSELKGVSHPYNASKVMGDVAAQLYANFFDLPISIIRHGNVYGPNDLHWDRVIPATIKRVFSGQPPIIRGDTTRDYIYVEELVQAYLVAAGLHCKCILNLGAEKASKTSEVVDIILELCNRVDLIPVKEPLWKGELVNQHFLETSAKTIIGWTPKISLREGLQKTVFWYLSYMRKWLHE